MRQIEVVLHEKNGLDIDAFAELLAKKILEGAANENVQKKAAAC